MSDAAVRAIARALTTAQLPGSGLASQQAAHATIVVQLRALGLDAGTARVLADRSQAAEFHPGQALSPALDRAHARAATTRAAYLVGAAKRLADRRGLDRLDQQATERRYLNRHVEAQQAREQAAQRVDGAASMYGNVLGWWARLDDRTTPKCRHHHGANFRADAPPALGLPGETHGGNCRCIAGPPHPRGPRLTPAPADAPAEEVAMSRNGTLRSEDYPALLEWVRDRGAIELAGNKKLADSNEVTESGLHYNPKTKTFRPATQAEKDAAGKKGGDFNSKHPRAAAGSPEGGQFVPLGTARDDKAAAARKDKGATDAYQSIGSAMVANARTGREKIRALSDDALGKLTRVAYSSKTSDPKVVALRMALAAELRTRGKNVTDFGAQGGNAAPKRAVKRQPSTAGLTKSRGAVVLDGKVSDAKAAELKAAGWKGRPGDKREALYPPPGVSLSRADGIELATSSASLDASPRSNWVEETAKDGGGGLPRGIRKVARALKQRYPAWPLSRCIAVAISRSKVWAAGGSAKGARNTAEWTALKARNAARTATTLARTAEPTGDIEMAASPASGGKTPTRNDVKGMVASDSKVPTKLKPKFRQRVMAHARNCKSEDCIPNHWRGGNPDKPGQTTSATASTPPGKKIPFGSKKAAPFGAKKS